MSEKPGRGHPIPPPYNTCKPPQLGGADYNYNDNAYANMASRDYENVDPGATSGAHVTQIEGFANFVGALGAAGAAQADVKLSWTTSTLGNDVQGVDWSFAGAVETRTYTGGTFTFTVNGEEIVSAPTPVLTVTIDYHDPDSCVDDQISAESELVPAGSFNIEYAGGDATITAIAQGLIDDITANGGLTLFFDSVQPAGQAEFTDGVGRGGAFFEVQTLRLR